MKLIPPSERLLVKERRSCEEMSRMMAVFCMENVCASEAAVIAIEIQVQPVPENRCPIEQPLS